MCYDDAKERQVSGLYYMVRNEEGMEAWLPTESEPITLGLELTLKPFLTLC